MAKVLPLYQQDDKKKKKQDATVKMEPSIIEKTPDEIINQQIAPRPLEQVLPVNQSANTLINTPGLQNVDQPQVPMTDLQKAQRDYSIASSAPVEKQGALNQGLFWALQGLGKFADEVRGVRNDQPVQWLGQAKHDYQVGKAGRQLAPLLAQRDSEIKAQQEQGKIIGQSFDNKKKMVEAIQAINPTFGKYLDQQLKEGTITAEIADKAKAYGYGDVPVGDYRNYETREIGGETYATPKIGRPDYQKTNAPVDPSKAPITRTLPDGTQVSVTGAQALNAEALQAYRQAQLDVETGKYNQNQLNGYKEKLDKWAIDEESRGKKITEDVNQSIIHHNTYKELEAQVSRAESRAESIKNNPRFDREPDLQKEYANLQKEIDINRLKAEENRSKSNALINNAKNSKANPKPTMGGSIETPTLGATYTEAQVEQVMKSTGKTRPEIDEWAKRKGVKIIK